jgi:TonB family protein
VNCAECEKEPLTPGHFCPCCGRKLSLQERRALETNSPPSRCQSCGVFSADGDLCKSCQQAFAPVLGTTTGTEPSNDSATADSQKAPAVDMMAEVALPPPVAKVDAVKIAGAVETAKAQTAQAVADMTAQAYLARAKNPPVVTRRPIVSAPPPQRRSRTPMLITAVTVIVIVIGAVEGARRFGLLSPRQAAREGQRVQATPAAKSITPAELPALPSDTYSAPTIVAENRAPAIVAAQIAPPTPSPSQTPKPKATPTPKPTPKAAASRRQPVRQANSSNQRVVPVVAPAPPPETPAPVPASPPALVVAVNSPRASAPLTGRFFERKDVDEPPKVATRVAPKLPANVPARLRNGAVVVRVLVSRTGHPFHVSVLRGSMLGRSSDEAVVAAVTQWTFSPARKQGEPVNCWFNVGVPLAQAN